MLIESMVQSQEYSQYLWYCCEVTQVLGMQYRNFYNLRCNEIVPPSAQTRYCNE